MSLGSRTARHDTARVQKVAVDSSIWWEYKPQQRVMTIDGIAGTVTAVLDGPHPGSEAYEVRLDDGMGGGQYMASQLSSAATTTASHDHEATGLHLATEDYPELGTILHDRPPIERIEHLAAKVAGRDPFEIRHVEHGTGGTKFPTKFETTAHHPETGDQVGHARYFPPKRKGGPISINEVKGHAPGAASAMLNDIEGRHPGSKTVFLNEVKRNNNNPDVTGHPANNAGKPSDWDTHYPNVKDTIHRGLSVRMPSHSANTVNNSSKTKDEHLDALHREIGTSSAGTHWTEDEHAARLFANNAVSDHRTDIPVVLHAAKPDRKNIETRQPQLYRGGVFPYGDDHSKENEVPIRKGRDVSVTGMSWKPDAPHPDADENGWIHHTYPEPKHHTAAKDSTVYLRFGDWNKDTERSHNNVTGHTEDGVSVYDLDHHGHPKDPDPDFSRGHEHDESCDDDCDMDWGNQDYGNDTREEMDGRVHRAERARYNGADHPTTRAHLVRGEMVGIGHDGEPLLNKVKRVGDWIDHKHLFFPGAQPHRLARGPYDEGYEHPKGLPKQAAGEPPTGEQAEQDLPPCSYCGSANLVVSGDNGRNTQATCQDCHGTMSSWGGQFTPELIGDPSNHPSQQADPASGGVGGAGNLYGPQPVKQMNDADHSASLHRVAEEDYRMQHQTPEMDDTYGAPMHDLNRNGLFPKDVHQHHEWFTGQPTREMSSQLHKARGNPEHPVTIYRALPHGHKDINTHDWVGISAEYAKTHATSVGDNWPIIKTQVPAKHLESEGNDLNEWAYRGPKISNAEVHDPGGPSTRTGSLSFLASLDSETLFHFTASWSDVRNKAKRLRAEGLVRIVVASGDGIGGEVKGDNNVYETVLSYAPGSQKVAYWTCGCKWAAYAWGRSPAYRRFEGRMCSHALAMQFEAQARGMFGKTVMPDDTRPKWLRQRTPVVIQHERDTGKDLTRRAVPPGNMGRTFEGALVDETPPIVHLTRFALSEGAEPVEVMRSLLVLGYAHPDAKSLLKVASLEGPAHQTKCPDCGAAISSRLNRCPHCGAHLDGHEPTDLHEASKMAVKATCGECEGTGVIHHEHEPTDEESEDPDHVPGTWSETCDVCGGSGKVETDDLPEPDEDPHAKKVREHNESRVGGAPHGVGCPPFCPVQQRMSIPERQRVREEYSRRQAAKHGMLHTAEEDYWRAHRPGSPDDDAGAPLHDMAQSFPEDVYTHPHRYTVGRPHPETVQAMHRARGNPEAPVTIYRAQPKEHSSIRTGDWVTTSGDYAHQFEFKDDKGHHQPVVKATVPAKHLWSPADDLHEFGYWGPPIEHPEVHPRSPKHGAKRSEVDGPTHAGVVLKARDTGRILMLQRNLEDEDDPAAGTWEFPGGGIEDGDTTALHAGIREWEEEVGQKFPEGGSVHHVWSSPNGVYHGHVVVIPEERQVALHDGRVTTNPDDPDGKTAEQAAWWEVEHARKNPALRPECKSSPWKDIAKAGAQKTAAAWDPLEELAQPHTPPLHSESENPGSTGFATAQDPSEFDHPTMNTTLYGGAYGHLHGEPEAALPTTDGAEDFDNPAMWDVEQHPVTHDQIPELSGTLSPQQFTGSVADIVARFQATAGAQAINAGGGDSGDVGPSGGDIAGAARAFLDKTALKQFNFQEQQELITEGALDNVMARNSDRLDIADTHYHALEAALAAEESMADPDDIFA